ncbi:hypothetical protein [Spirosoma areae]
MKKRLLLLLLLGGSCSPKLRPGQEQVSRPYYVALKPTDWYEKPDSTSQRLIPLSPGDTIRTVRAPGQLRGWQAVERKGTVGFLRNPSLLPVQGQTDTPIPGDSLFSRSINQHSAYRDLSTARKPPVSTRYSTPTPGAAIYTGPGGERYYYNRKGAKTYLGRQ